MQFSQSCARRTLKIVLKYVCNNKQLLHKKKFDVQLIFTQSVNWKCKSFIRYSAKDSKWKEKEADNEIDENKSAWVCWCLSMLNLAFSKQNFNEALTLSNVYSLAHILHSINCKGEEETSRMHRLIEFIQAKSKRLI